MSDFILKFSHLEQSFPQRYLLLYHALREAIALGAYPVGSKLPSSRQLAQLYGFSRGTVTTVYEMLWADGYLEGRKGSGTFIANVGAAPGGPATTGQKAAGVTGEKKPAPAPRPTFSAWTKRMSQYEWQFVPPAAASIHFYPGYPDMKYFPFAEWQRCVREGLRNLNYLVGKGSGSAAGLEQLRTAVATHLRDTRGMNVDADHIVIVNGSAQAVMLLMQILVDKGDKVVVENPSYGAMRRAIKIAGGRCIPVSLDEEGMQAGNWDSRLAFVTPGFQYPTGIAMSLARRLGLLEWASRQNALIIEDDYDCEFRRIGRPIEPLKVLDRSGRVIYLGTFTKSIHMALRLGYAVLPDCCRSEFLEAKKMYEPITTALVEQAAAALFIKHGAFARHLRRMKKVYAKKHERFCELIEQYLPSAFSWTASEIGLQRFGYWNGTEKSLRSLQERCRARGLYWQTAHGTFLRNARPAVVWGFSHLTEKEMLDGIKTIAKCM